MCYSCTGRDYLVRTLTQGQSLSYEQKILLQNADMIVEVRDLLNYQCIIRQNYGG